MILSSKNKFISHLERWEETQKLYTLKSEDLKAALYYINSNYYFFLHNSTLFDKLKKINKALFQTIEQVNP